MALDEVFDLEIAGIEPKEQRELSKCCDKMPHSKVFQYR